jgi:hypothetical protein
MRRWFYLDDMNEHDRATVTRWHLRVICGYALVSLALFGWIALQTEGVQAQFAKLSTVTSASAAAK